MKLSTPFLFILAAATYVHAAHDGLSRLGARHHNVARNAIERRASGGRCKVRTTTSASSSTAQSTSTTHHSTSTKKSTPTALTTSTKSTDSSSSSNDSSSSSSASSVISGLIRITDSSCGSPNAKKTVTGTAGPNGQEDWFNCGVDNGGWNPPHVTVSDIVTVELADAVQDPNSPFKACSAYIDTFYKYASQHGLPAILVASIAMQESSCNPATVGGGGEQGLMQITKDKCGGAPGGNCKDIDFNIKTGTAFFAQTLSNNGGSLLKTFGNYNGWQEGMTIASATAARWTSCCRCQNNLDYLQQVMNGWLLNQNPYNAHMGKYFNLDVCDQ